MPGVKGTSGNMGLVSTLPGLSTPTNLWNKTSARPATKQEIEEVGDGLTYRHSGKVLNWVMLAGCVSHGFMCVAFLFF